MYICKYINYILILTDEVVTSKYLFIKIKAIYSKAVLWVVVIFKY